MPKAAEKYLLSLKTKDYMHIFFFGLLLQIRFDENIRFDLKIAKRTPLSRLKNLNRQIKYMEG